MSHFTLNENHPLIPREQNYVLDRKIITIHSFDRDISKWPKGNHFEIDLPADITNVQSMRLVEITIPNSHYVFTNAYQNTKLKFSISTQSTSPTLLKDLIITIDEGSYSADQLALEIATKMNRAVANALYALGTWQPYDGFVCAYNPVTNTFWFGNKHGDKFKLFFGEKLPYTLPCDQPEMWNKYSKWGLPAYLGYCKKKYTSKFVDPSYNALDLSGGFGFDFENTQWVPSSTPSDPSNVSIVDISGGTDAADASGNARGNCCQMDIFGDQAMYMEIEKYNSMDELVPWSENTMGAYNNDYSAKVNSAFAKIPIGLSNAFALYGDSKHFYLMNATTFSPPIDRIKRLRFTFRFHDGRRVEFKCMPFNFSLEINMLHNEQPRRMNVRIPASFV